MFEFLTSLLYNCMGYISGCSHHIKCMCHYKDSGSSDFSSNTTT
ncbi:hypothetical protein BDA96_03G188300 [Sorghum bicolor]|uniref:Uncharacterized protein n=2 Tax=Sorghum bicolor TaxID=4558 RepID=A0A921RCK9_SORBI|nr:hypothetical protein BDA96_03G188300 [Sorghum bicolor]OQU86931.1 hypothetical protein SORBI_3003G174475 [Sorghum bicolor]